MLIQENIGANLLKAKAKFRAIGVILPSNAGKDHGGAGAKWNFIKKEHFLAIVNPHLVACGLELVETMVSEDGKNFALVRLFHIDSGEFMASTTELKDVTPSTDRNGNALYLASEIEVGKSFGYWSRTLSISILGLTDVDRSEDAIAKGIETVSEKIEAETKIITESQIDILKNLLGVNWNDMLFTERLNEETVKTITVQKFMQIERKIRG